MKFFELIGIYYKYGFVTKRFEIPAKKDIDSSVVHTQAFRKHFYFLWMPVYRTTIFYENVPEWAEIQYATIGWSHWKSSFPEYCFKYDLMSRERANNKRH
jgi:hypothetical protein